MPEIKPITTHYKGYKFRSRLEARWAVFFDALKFKWVYESEGYDLGILGWYLPDFVVTTKTGRKCIYEIKPKGSKEGKEKITALLKKLNDAQHEGVWWGAVLYGDPYDVIVEEEKEKLVICPRCGYIDPEHMNCYGNTDVMCCPCDWETPGGRNPPEESIVFKGINYTPWKGTVVLEGKDNIEVFWDKIVTAATKARSAKFEHKKKRKPKLPLQSKINRSPPPELEIVCNKECITDSTVCGLYGTEECNYFKSP